MNIECVAPVGDRCGEGPVWNSMEQALYWTDINRFLVHRFNVRDQSVRFWQFDEPVTALALTDQDDILLVALGSGLVYWEPHSGKQRKHGFDLPGWPRVRLNDGRADPGGRFWFGSMRNNVNSDGSSFEAGGNDGILLSVQGGVPAGRCWKSNIGIANTLAWSPDRKTFYFADSLANRIWKYDYDVKTGLIQNERIFFSGFERGAPDGSAVDSEGYLWNCRYGGKCIVRLDQDGRIDRILEMPVTNVTSCTFGDHDLQTLYITTSSIDAPVGERLAGGLFTFRAAVPGLPENRYLTAGL